MKINRRYRGLAVITSALMAFTGAVAGEPPAASEDNRHVFEVRQQLLARFRDDGADAIPALIAALDDDTALIRRTAAHLLVRLGEPALTGLEAGLQNQDFQVRRIMMHGLSDWGLFPEYWPIVLQDVNPSIRREVRLYFMQKYPLPEGAALDAVVSRLAAAYAGAPVERRRHVVETVAELTPLTESGRRLMIQAVGDVDDRIRVTAFTTISGEITLDWPAGEALLAAAESDESDAVRAIGFAMRTNLLLVKEYQLPARNWRFAVDPDDRGRDQGWYRPEFDDAAWRADARIETAWGRFLDQQYVGVAWYRREIDVPAAEGWDSALLHFGGVDECAWVWLDGQYLGEHDMGPGGWNVPFTLDAAAVIRPGSRQHIAVRAKNTAANGGIWQPVRLLLLRDWPRD